MEGQTFNGAVDSAYKALMNSVYENDLEEQLSFMSVIAKARNISEEYLLRRGGMFIPNAEYVRYHLGPAADNDMAGFYRQLQPIWQLYYIFPITNLVGDIVGIVGWDAYGKYTVEKGEALSLPLYKVSGADIFNRNAYFMSDYELIKKKFMTDGPRVVFVVDGVFDGISLSEKDVPTICLMGSAISREVIFFLKFYDIVYVVHDNDDAGVRLLKTLKRVLNNVYAVTQTVAKDIEEGLRKDTSLLSGLKVLCDNPIKDSIRLTGAGLSRN